MFPIGTRILLVDDSKTTKSLLKSILSGLGYNEVDTAEDGQDGVEKVMAADAQGASYGLIISDWKMPRLDGHQFLNFIRKSSMNPSVPFLMITAEGENSTVLTAIQAGASGYVLKPFTDKQVEERLRKIWTAKK